MLLCMGDGPSVGDCIGELPDVAYRASEGVLELYAAIRQARALGATFDQLVAASGLSRGNVQRVVAGEIPKFAAG
jgi:hypothetical protein